MTGRQPRSAIKISAQEARKLEIAPWDALAPLRARDLDAGKDPSFESVTLPTFRAMLRKHGRASSLLDIGCGVGRLTKRLADLAQETITAIDPSPVSAQLAQQHLGSSHHRAIHNMTIQQYVNLRYGGHDVAVASMVMQDLVDVTSFLEACRSSLLPGGRLLISISHPYYWPTYWHYDDQPWYRYDREIYIRSEFRTSLSSSGIETLHVHRPLASYFTSLRRAGFTIEQLLEPMMPLTEQKRSGVHWTTPHFLFLEAKRRS